MEELDNLDQAILNQFRNHEIHNQYTLCEIPQILQMLATMTPFDRWNMVKGRLQRLEARDYIFSDPWAERSMYSMNKYDSGTNQG